MTDLTPDEQDESDHEVGLATELFGDMLDASDAEEVDPVWVAYSLFLSLVHFLTIAGWTTDELQADVAEHSERGPGTLH